MRANWCSHAIDKARFRKNRPAGDVVTSTSSFHQRARVWNTGPKPKWIFGKKVAEAEIGALRLNGAIERQAISRAC